MGIRKKIENVISHVDGYLFDYVFSSFFQFNLTECQTFLPLIRVYFL